MGSLIVVDCEAPFGVGAPSVGDMTEFGAVDVNALQWINFYFWRYFGQNPFGHSGRRIADYYAGLMGDFRTTQKWKRLRRTKHDHHPVHDALGNAEALIRIFDGER